MNASHDPPLSLGAILSSRDLIETIRRLAEPRFKEVRCELVCGLDEAIPVGRQMQESGVDVIIGRRGTAEMLRVNLSIPVLAVAANPMDILISMRRAVELGGSILVTSFKKRISGLEILEELYGVKISQGIYHDSASLERVVVEAKERGVEVIVGGGVSMKHARACGLKGVEFYISEEAVAFTIEDALAVGRLNRQEQEKAKRYQCVTDSSADAIISVNRHGLVTTVNRAARELFAIKDPQNAGYRLGDLLPRASLSRILETKKPLYNRLEKVRGGVYLASHIPIVVNQDVEGIVSIFRDATAVLNDANEVRRNFAKGLVASYTIDDLIHASPVMKEVVKKARRYAASDSTILIGGETGTGKEILAQGIHNLGRRAKGPFVSLNCAALPEPLLENELFGHEEGAFTGSRRGGKIGLFELAHTGTIFLDEIASTPPSVQASLLRVLQEKKVMRIGSDRLIPIDVRVLAASNRDLVEEVRAGRFREDLFFRLNVLAITLPPLRERLEDLPLIVGAITERLAKRYGTACLAIPSACLRRLTDYPWPGNVRQLENFLERLILLCGDRFDRAVFNELYRELEHYPVLRPRGTQRRGASERGRLLPKKAIQEALTEAKYCRTKAARMLGISRTTLWRRMKALS